MKGITSEGLWVWIAFGKARAFLRLHVGKKPENSNMLHTIFLKFSLTALCSREQILSQPQEGPCSPELPV